MDTKIYKTQISITLEPIWHEDAPEIEVGVGNQIVKHTLTSTETFDFELQSESKTVELLVRFLNKKDSDTVPEKNLDKAVIVKAVKINGITDDRFVWTGCYEPLYPEPWYSQQALPPSKVLVGHNYLGWNGQWMLSVQIPAFRWMHQVLSLGWIYD